MYNKGYQARIELDSISPSGDRLTTFVVKYNRFVHSEMLTHRMFSRNSSSSRAIPVRKLMNRIIEDPAIPVYWGKNKRGMQAKEELQGNKRSLAINLWLGARYAAYFTAWLFTKLGVHKQIANRILEPWMFIEVIITATDYDNFFKLRCHEDAQPEIKHIAEMMKELYDKSVPKQLKEGEWHLPFADHLEESLENKKKISVARCARVSYTTHDGKIDIGRDIKLHDYLTVQYPPHHSPTEHVCMALSESKRNGNVIGWKQYRQDLEERILLDNKDN